MAGGFPRISQNFPRQLFYRTSVNSYHSVLYCNISKHRRSVFNPWQTSKVELFAAKRSILDILQSSEYAHALFCWFWTGACHLGLFSCLVLILHESQFPLIWCELVEKSDISQYFASCLLVKTTTLNQKGSLSFVVFFMPIHCKNITLTHQFLLCSIKN